MKRWILGLVMVAWAAVAGSFLFPDRTAKLSAVIEPYTAYWPGQRLRHEQCMRLADYYYEPTMGTHYHCQVSGKVYYTGSEGTIDLLVIRPDALRLGDVCAEWGPPARVRWVGKMVYAQWDDPPASAVGYSRYARGRWVMPVVVLSIRERPG